MVWEAFLNTIEEYKLIAPKDKVIVALSGGPDSVCLLHLLYRLKTHIEFKLEAVHVNHGLRGRESDDDEQYVRELCNSFAIALKVFSCDIKKMAADLKISIEEAGRKARYDILYKYAWEIGAERICTAHNRNDQAETVLMNMIRGSGPEGLSGMEYKKDMVIRPILAVSREDIEAYLRQYGLKPRFDSSNKDNAFTRNRIRNVLIPLMDREFAKNTVNTLFKLSSLLREDNTYLNNLAEDHFNRISRYEGEKLIIILSEYIKICLPLRTRILRIALKSIKGNIMGIENRHIDLIDALASKGITGNMLNLPEKICTDISYDKLRFYSCSEVEKLPALHKRVLIPGVTPLDELRAVIKTEYSPEFFEQKVDSFIQFFDYESIKDGIYIRYRKNGDVFSPYRSKGIRKLKEFFIDCKIPREIRDKIPLLAKGNEIVWIIGYRISDKFCATENTKTVLKVEIDRI